MAIRIILILLLLYPGYRVSADDLYYLGQRIPDIKRVWSSNDYQRLIDALKTIDSKQKKALPRRGGEFTGPIYQRMINPENFRPQLDIYSPLEIRQNEAREVLFKLKELMRLYFDFDAGRQPYGAEALGLMIHSLREQAILFTLTVEFWTTLSQTEQRNSMRLQGMQEAKAAAAMLMSSSFDYLELTKQFEQGDLVLYAAELAGETPVLFVHLPADMRISLLQRIGSLAEHHPYPAVQQSMQSLLPVVADIQVDMEQGSEPGRDTPLSRPLDLRMPNEKR